MLGIIGNESTLKFLWDVPLHVNFQIALVALNLELCRVSYTLLNSYYLEKDPEFHAKLQKFITNSILIQWLIFYMVGNLRCLFHVKIDSLSSDG